MVTWVHYDGGLCTVIMHPHHLPLIVQDTEDIMAQVDETELKELFLQRISKVYILNMYIFRNKMNGKLVKKLNNHTMLWFVYLHLDSGKKKQKNLWGKLKVTRNFKCQDEKRWWEWKRTQIKCIQWSNT